MAKPLIYKEFEAIAIKEFSCEIYKGAMIHLTRHHEGVLKRTPVLSPHEKMNPRMIEQMCKRLKLPLKRFEDYL